MINNEDKLDLLDPWSVDNLYIFTNDSVIKLIYFMSVTEKF